MQEQLKYAAQAIAEGALVGMPTETVYGLAADACNAEAVLRVFEAKGRPHFDPLIIHVHDQAMAQRYVHEHPLAQSLMDAFWPGPLTLVLKKRDLIPDIVSSGLDTVAVRCPDHPVALALIAVCDRALAAPSANLFGHISPTCAAHVQQQLGAAVACVLDGGPCRVGVESTVLAFNEAGQVEILRPGGLSAEDLAQVLGYTPAQLSLAHIESDVLAQVSPGMLKNHYAPRIPLRIKGADEAWPSDDELGLLCWSAVPPQHKGPSEVLSPQARTDEAARNLFAAMRRLEDSGAKALLAELVPTEGLGRAVNDRLRRAAGVA